MQHIKQPAENDFVLPIRISYGLYQYWFLTKPIVGQIHIKTLNHKLQFLNRDIMC